MDSHHVTGTDYRHMAWHFQTYKGFPYKNCSDSTQITDILDSGNNNVRRSFNCRQLIDLINLRMLSQMRLFLNLSQNVIFNKLNGVCFNGPLGGVLPSGPNGIPAFDGITAYFPPSKSRTGPQASGDSSALSIYRLHLQGLTSDVKCISDTESPITFGAISGDVFQYNGTCNGSEDVLISPSFTSPASNNSLGFWACKTSQSGGDEQYLLYLRGFANYEPTIGNMTCTVSPIQPAIFAVTYDSFSDCFSSQLHSTAGITNPFSGLVLRSIRQLAAVVYQSQNAQSNLIAESVASLQQLFNQDDTFLPLYGEMLQGMLEYEVCPDALLHIPLFISSHNLLQATYTRLLYSTITDPARPDSCNRTVTGHGWATFRGWARQGADTIGLLMPMTLVNLASLILTLMAMFLGKKVLYQFDPTDPRSLIFASGKAPDNARETTEAWDCQVHFNVSANRCLHSSTVSDIN